MRLAFPNIFPFLISVLSSGTTQTKFSFSGMNKTVSLQFFLIWIFTKELNILSYTQVSTSPLNVILEAIHMSPDVPPNKCRGQGTVTSFFLTLRLQLCNLRLQQLPWQSNPPLTFIGLTAKQFQVFFVCTTDKPGFPIHHWGS